MWSNFGTFDSWADFDRAFLAFDELRKDFDRYLGTSGAPRRRIDALTGDAPLANVYDNGSAFVVTADLPGMRQQDVSLTLHNGVLTLSGERKVGKPEGYTVHRQERISYRFNRSFRFPVDVDPERTTATLKNGVLTVTVEKAAASQPRQITVNN